jgi:hypothetical protein
MLVTRANREQSEGSTELLGLIQELRRTAEERQSLAEVDGSALADRIRLLGRTPSAR